MTDQIFRIIIQVDPSQARSGTSQAAASILNVQRTVINATRHVQVFNNTFITTMNNAARASFRLRSALLAVFGGLGVIQFTRELIQLTDAYTNLQNKLRNVTSSEEELHAVQDALLRIANETRTSLEGTATIYQRLANSTGDLGITQQGLLEILTTLNKAIAISGANSIEARAALIQFSQGLAKGRLDGEELNSIMEQTPILAKIIARELGVQAGALKELGKAGKITGDVILQALREAEEEIAEGFAKSIPTISQALQVAQNQILAAIGAFNEATGASEGLARSIIYLSENFETIAPIVAGLSSALLVGLAGRAIPAVIAGIRTLAIVIATTPVGALAAAVGLVAAFAVANVTTEETVIDLGAALSELEKTLTTLDGLYEDAGDAAVGASERSQDAINAEIFLLEEKIKKQRESLALSRTQIERDLTEARRDLDAARSELFDFNNGGSVSSYLFYNSPQEELQLRVDSYRQYVKELEAQLVLAEEALGNFDRRQEETAERRAGTLIAPPPKPEKPGRKKLDFGSAFSDVRNEIAVLTAEISQRGALAEILRLENDLKRKLTATELDEVNASIARLDSLQRQDEILRAIRGPQEDFKQNMSALDALFASGKVDLEEYNKYVDLLSEELRKASGESETLASKLIAFGKEAGDVAGGIADTIGGAFSRAGDALAEFVSTGKADFGSLINSIVADLARLAVQSQIVSPIANFLGNSLGGGFLSSLFGGGGGGIGATPASGLQPFSTPAFANGGSMLIGGSHGLDRNLLSLNNIPIGRVSRGETLSVGTGRAAPNVHLTIIDNAGVGISQEQSIGSDGSVDIVATLERKFESGLKSGRYDSTMAARYNIRPGRTRRS